MSSNEEIVFRRRCLSGQVLGIALTLACVVIGLGSLKFSEDIRLPVEDTILILWHLLVTCVWCTISVLAVARPDHVSFRKMSILCNGFVLAVCVIWVLPMLCLKNSGALLTWLALIPMAASIVNLLFRRRIAD
jgi:hypothetical protein